MRQILCTGSQSIKTIEHYRHPKMQAQVTPLLVLEDTTNVWGEPQVSMGILLQCIPLTFLEENNEDEKHSPEPCEIFGKLPCSIDIVRGWRALVLLEAMVCVNDTLFALDIYEATERIEADDSYHQRITQEVRAEFEDPCTYDEIMQHTVPVSILQLVIQMADAKTEHLDLDSITDEIEMGTIRWSQELKRIGVEHPDHRQAVTAAKARIVTHYSSYLFSYAAYSEHPYAHDHADKSWIMLMIEWRVYDCLERGIEQLYGTDIVVLLAILSAEIECDDVQEELENEHPSEREGGKPFTRPMPEIVIDDTIAWFFQSFCSDPLSTTRSQESCRELLVRLHQQWDHLPITHPLVK